VAVRSRVQERVAQASIRDRQWFDVAMKTECKAAPPFTLSPVERCGTPAACLSGSLQDSTRPVRLPLGLLGLRRYGNAVDLTAIGSRVSL
jgi:hypothetical protein